MKTFALNQRRHFLKQLTLAGLAAPFISRDLLAQPAGGLLRHASFGSAGMAGGDITSLLGSKLVKLVAVADVDAQRLDQFKAKHPDVKTYKDWRELLDKEHKNLDSVNVSTPDHMHAPIAMSAMQLGKHVYCQKPLAHDIYEVRRLAEMAREKKLVSQMGIQIHSDTAYRMAVKFVQEGVIGKIKEVHSWSNKKWGDPAPLPTTNDPVPEWLDWNLWLGVCAERPFVGNGYYHPNNWRKRLDFGTGTFGDMGCHIYDPVFNALAVTSPVSLRSEGPAPSATNWAVNALIHYTFGGTRFTEGPTVKVIWYDGDQKPPKEIQELLKVDPITAAQAAPAPAEATGSKKGRKRDAAPKIQGEFRELPPQGSIFIGTKGVMLLPHIAKPELYPDNQFKDFVFPKLEQQNHYTQFAEACLGRGKTSASFDYSGPLTEAVLLGGVATRFPQKELAWNGPALKFTNSSEANQLLRRAYRKGWEVKGLS